MSGILERDERRSELLRELVEAAEEPVATGRFYKALDEARVLLGLPHRHEREQS